MPISFNILSIPYDNNLAVRIADEYPDLPGKKHIKMNYLQGFTPGVNSCITKTLPEGLSIKEIFEGESMNYHEYTRI